MATHPTEKGTKTIGLNMKMEMATKLEDQAQSMQLSTSQYCRLVLTKWLESGKKLELKEKS